MADSSVIIIERGKGFKSLERLLKEMPKKVPTVLSRSINRTLPAGSKIVKAEIKKKYPTISRLKNFVTTYKAKRSYLIGRIITKGERAPLINFGARKTRVGVSADTGNGRKVYQGSFVKTMPSGHKGVFKRATNATRWSVGRPKTSSPNLPIYELFGPSVVSVLTDKMVGKKVRNAINDRLKIEVDRQVNYVLLKAKGKA